MKKQQYIAPCVEIVTVNGGYMMYGPASVPSDPFNTTPAPARHAPELSNDSVPVF